MRPLERRALAVGACALGFYLLHFGWFVLFGPPDWFQGVGERTPEISSVALGSAFDGYLDELDRPREASLGSAGTTEAAGIAGRVVREDRLAEGTALRQTRDGARDHLYVLTADRAGWRELALPTLERLEDARLLRVNGLPRVMLVGRRGWWPFVGNYGRFWRALMRADLRPDSGLYLSDPERGPSRYLFPGRLPVPSPNRERLAFLRSDRRGFHSVHFWEPGAEKDRIVVSLWEADPGSGPSFRFGWSSDSAVLFIRGLSRGFGGTPEPEPREIRLLYDVVGDRLVEIRR